MPTTLAPTPERPTVRPSVPTCLQLLQLLDQLEHELTDPDDPGPPAHFLCPRAQTGPRDRRYESDDLEEQRQALLSACGRMDCAAESIPLLRVALGDALDLVRALPEERRGGLDPDACLRAAEEAWSRDPRHPLEGLRQARRGSDLWLRVALAVEPLLPAPWEDWSLQLWRLYRVGESLLRDFHPRRQWDLEDMEERQWAKRELVRELRERGWLPGEAAMDARIASEDAVMMAAAVAERAAAKIAARKNRPSGPWCFDPVAWTWVRSSQVPAACAKVGHLDRKLGFFWVLQAHPGWSEPNDGLSGFIDLVMHRREAPPKPVEA